MSFDDDLSAEMERRAEANRQYLRDREDGYAKDWFDGLNPYQRIAAWKLLRGLTQ